MKRIFILLFAVHLASEPAMGNPSALIPLTPTSTALAFFQAQAFSPASGSVSGTGAAVRMAKDETRTFRAQWLRPLVFLALGTSVLSMHIGVGDFNILLKTHQPLGQSFHAVALLLDRNAAAFLLMLPLLA